MTGDRFVPDDGALVARVVHGSQEALGILYDRHADAIFAVACRLTTDRQMAEEVVQETFLALWNRAELFDASVGSLAAWLHTIARNRTVDRLRAAGRRPTLVPFGSVAGGDDDATAALERVAVNGSVIGGADLGPGPEAALDAADVRLAIGQALATMPAAERTVIELAYRNELSQSEIAARLGWPLGTVKTRTRRGLGRLREALADSFGPASRERTEQVSADEGSR